MGSFDTFTAGSHHGRRMLVSHAYWSGTPKYSGYTWALAKHALVAEKDLRLRNRTKTH
jgi:hypothetical protein